MYLVFNHQIIFNTLRRFYIDVSHEQLFLCKQLIARQKVVLKCKMQSYTNLIVK